MLTPGSQLSNYTIDRHLGSGSFGDVYTATIANKDEAVAIKVCRGSNPEAEILNRLNHPSIPGCIEQFSHDGQQITVMQYVEGTPCSAILSAIHKRSRHGLRVSDACADCDLTPIPDAREDFISFGVRIIRDIASALQHAHENKIFHQDVKPENILVTSDGRGVLIDWGAAADQTAESNSRGGTIRYMRPATLETVAGLKPADQNRNSVDSVQDDLYALGIVLHEIVAGDLPFPATSTDTSVIAQARESLAVRSNVADRVLENTNLPFAIRVAVSMCLADENKPDVKHYESAQQLAEDLSSYLQGRAPVHALETTFAKLNRLWRRHNRVFKATTTIVLLTVCAIITDRWFVLTSLKNIDERRKTATLNVTATTELDRSLFEVGIFPDTVAMQQRRATVAHGVAALLLSKEEAENAATLLRKVVQIAPENGDAYNDLGIACFKMAQYDNAINAFSVALELDCDHSAVLSNRGAAFASLGQNEKALKDFGRAIQLNPGNPEAKGHMKLLQKML